MKIMCQEHYDKVVQYAESIDDKTLHECLKRLERREQNPHHPCEIELYKDFAPYSFLFKERYPDGRLGVVGGLVYHGCPDRSHCFIDGPFHGWMTHTLKVEYELSIPAGHNKSGRDFVFIIKYW